MDTESRSSRRRFLRRAALTAGAGAFGAVAAAVPAGAVGSVAGTLTIIDPIRCYDSRDGYTPTGVTKGPLAPGVPRSVDVTVGGGAPIGTLAVVVNITAVPTSPNGYLQSFVPGGAYPTTSVLNWSVANNPVANGATLKTGTFTTIGFLANSSTHLIVDITGYYK